MLPVLLIILVVIGAIPLLFYLRKRTMKRYAGYLKDAKSIIRGEWIKYGLVLEGEYKGRKVRCGIEEENIMAFLKMKLNMVPTDLKRAKYEWIDWHWKIFNEPMPSLLFNQRFFEKGYFTEQLEKLFQFCEKTKRGEIYTVSPNINSAPVKLAYKSKIVKHVGPPETRHINFVKNLGIPIGTRIFIFSCYDEESIRVASEIKFDYGFCIECKLISDIEDFKKKAGMKQPAYIANDQIVESFNVTSYPALITVKKDVFQIQEGYTGPASRGQTYEK